MKLAGNGSCSPDLWELMGGIVLHGHGQVFLWGKGPYNQGETLVAIRRNSSYNWVAGCCWDSRVGNVDSLRHDFPKCGQNNRGQFDIRFP